MMNTHVRARARASAIVVILAFMLAGCSTGGGSQKATQAPGNASRIGSDEELVVAISGMTTPKEGLTYYRGLSEYIGRKVGRKVRLVHKADYAELNEMLNDGRVDISYSCSGPYAIGHDQFGLQLVVAPIVNGSATYRAYIIVPKSSEATSLASLKGKTFAFTDPDSNTGCLVPTYMLAVQNTSPEEFFSRVVYTYSHDNSIKAVANGSVAGASVDSLIWDYSDAQNPEFTSKTRIVTQSDRYGIPPIVARPDLDPALVEAIRSAYLSAHKDPEGRQLLDKMNIERFVTIDDSAYDSIRRMDAWVKKQQQKAD